MSKRIDVDDRDWASAENTDDESGDSPSQSRIQRFSVDEFSPAREEDLMFEMDQDGPDVRQIHSDSYAALLPGQGLSSSNSAPPAIPVHGQEDQQSVEMRSSSSSQRMYVHMQTEPDWSTVDEDKREFLEFLCSWSAYDTMPLSAKVIVLDVDLTVKEAFHIAFEHGIVFATLWDSEIKQLVGMLTITDFIDILLHFHHSPDATNVIQELEDHKIREWREIGGRKRPQLLVSVIPETALYDALLCLKRNRIHRLPVKEAGSVLLNIFTYESAMEFVFYNLGKKSPVFQKSIEDLNIGTFHRVVTASFDTPLHIALNVLTSRSISAVPVIDERGQLQDIFSRSDVMYLAADRRYDLDIPLSEALQLRPKIDKLITCRARDTLFEVMEKIVVHRVHRLIVVDDSSHVSGVVAITDIFDYFLSP